MIVGVVVGVVDDEAGVRLLHGAATSFGDLCTKDVIPLLATPFY